MAESAIARPNEEATESGPHRTAQPVGLTSASEHVPRLSPAHRTWSPPPDYAVADVTVVDAAVVEPSDSPLLDAFNTAVAALTLILISPLLLLIAVAILATSGRPIIYAQTRTGIDRRWRSAEPPDDRRKTDLGGRVYTIYKFRTMTNGAEHQTGAIWAVRGDPRTTAVGRLLRRFRCDELPQLWNVLRGEMSIVGPRPERPPIVMRLREEIPAYSYRHRVKPGITGLAQINQAYDASIEDVRTKVCWDLEYIRRRSLWLDLQIMVKTIPTVLIKFQGW